tara:strand:+ start:242 stop:877 length:636 start_codon:yes stop_codon:yes gene_type:complete
MKTIPQHKHVPFGPYLTKMETDPNFCKRLLELGKTLTTKHTQYLAGAIDDEYVYDLKKDVWVREGLQIYVDNWINGFKQFSGDHSFHPKYRIHPVWINFQKAKEYNPVHTHPNCNLSFILFLDVPKEIMTEKRETKGAPPGHTGFLYGEDAQGFITHRIIKPETGLLYMFPSNLRHYVSHFNSKVTRITVSGNIMFLETVRKSGNVTFLDR